MPNAELTLLITGAGSGLGRDLSRYFINCGHSVLITDLHCETAEATAEQLTTAGHPCRGYALDVTSAESIAEFFQTVGNSPIDVLVNNAGFQHVARLEEFSQQTWDRLTDVILKGASLMTRAVLPGMRSQGFGRIINIGSIHSLVASPYKSAYVAAKHALIGFSKAIALETSDVDITVNTICPSYIRTPLVESQIQSQAATHGLDEEAVIEQIMLKPMPKKAFITAEEVAAAIEYLISPQARNVTGQQLTIDGGWTAQ